MGRPLDSDPQPPLDGERSDEHEALLHQFDGGNGFQPHDLLARLDPGKTVGLFDETEEMLPPRSHAAELLVLLGVTGPYGSSAMSGVYPITAFMGVTLQQAGFARALQRRTAAFVFPPLNRALSDRKALGIDGRWTRVGHRMRD